MGQRHQAFVIARVRPKDEPTTTRYRCIAAFHHQWCYGRLPLLATRRFLTLAKNNADIIRSEIRVIDGKYGEDIDDIPCPYIAFLLATAWTTDLEERGAGAGAYTSGVSFFNGILDAGMRSDGGDNNDGITILDVTDPAQPAYCYISHGCTPETAEDYVRGYYSRPSPAQMQDENTRKTEESVLSIIASLAGEKLVQLSSLAEAWPSEYEVTDGQQIAPAQAETTGRALVPSLADLAVRPAVQHALSTGEIAELEQILEVPGKHLLVAEVLREQSSLTDSAIKLLSSVLAKDLKAHAMNPALDLSPYHLSSDQIVRLISEINGIQDIEELNLSDNANVDLQATKSVLSEIPRLKRLIVLGATSLSGEDVRSLIASLPNSSHLEALVHPSLLSAAEAPDYEPAFSLVFPSSMSGAVTCTLPLFTPASIVQVLTDLLSPVASSPYAISNPLENNHAAQAAFASLPRGVDKPWADRRVWFFPKPLANGLISHGWTFAADFPRHKVSRSKYALLRFEKGADPMTTPPCEIHDVASFLNKLEEEGRPAAPAAAVARLEEVMLALKNPPPCDMPGLSPQIKDALMQSKATEVMTREDVDAFMEDIGKQFQYNSMLQMATRRFY